MKLNMGISPTEPEHNYISIIEQFLTFVQLCSNISVDEIESGDFGYIT